MRSLGGPDEYHRVIRFRGRLGIFWNSSRWINIGRPGPGNFHARSYPTLVASTRVRYPLARSHHLAELGVAGT